VEVRSRCLRVRVALWLVAVALLSITACSAGSRLNTVVSERPHVASIFTASIKGFSIDHIALSGNLVAFGYEATWSSTGGPNEVRVINLLDGSNKLLAKSAWKSGMTDWVEATGDWIFWTDTAEVPSDASRPAPWAIYGIHWPNGKPVVLARSTFDSPEPVPRAGAGKLVWFQMQRRGSPATSIRYFDSATRKVATVVTLALPPSSIGATPQGPIWDSITPAGKSDLWTVGWAGGPPRRLTTTGAARNVRVSSDGRLAAWEIGNVTASGGLAFGDPLENRIRVLRDPSLVGPVAGASFIAYFADGSNALGVTTTGDAKPAYTATGDLDVACRFSADGDRLAFCTSPPDYTRTPTTITIHVDRVSQ
jgi:hypothetical protein